jgi:hypothetical protein
VSGPPVPMRHIGENMTRDYLEKNYIFRVVGAFNIFFAIIGLGALALQSWAFSLFPSEVTGGPGDPVKLAFRIGQLSSIVLLPLLAYFGLQLIRLRTKLIKPCAFLFVAEMVYLLLIRLFWPWIFSPSMLRAIRIGLLNAGFGLQILTGYPLIALIALYLLHRKIGREIT